MGGRIGISDHFVLVIDKNGVLAGFEQLAIVALQGDYVVERFLELVVGNEQLLVFLDGALICRKQKIDHLDARGIDEVFFPRKKHFDTNLRAPLLADFGVGEYVAYARNECLFVIWLCGEVICSCFERADNVSRI